MEKQNLSLSLVIPAYNEEKGIEAVIRDLKETLSGACAGFEIIVINDGSTDKTAEIALNAGARVITQPSNAGYGHSLLTGFSQAKYGHIAIIDADGSYPAKEILKLMPFSAQYDMVIGARQGIHYWGSALKYPARLAFKALSEYVTGQKIKDPNSGLRIFKRDSIPQDPILCRGFSFSTTLTLMFISTGKFVKFVPIEYTLRKGHSKIRIIRDTLRTAQVLVDALVYYNPLKLVLPFCLIPAAGFILSLFMFFKGKYALNPVMLEIAFMSAFFTVLFFLIGAALDQARLNRNNK